MYNCMTFICNHEMFYQFNCNYPQRTSLSPMGVTGDFPFPSRLQTFCGTEYIFEGVDVFETFTKLRSFFHVSIAYLNQMSFVL